MEHLRGIECFVKALEFGSIAAGARTLGISAASASQNIARLESSLGVRLLARSTRALALTPAGEQYHQHVQGLLDQLQHARAEVTAMQGQPQGRLKIGCSVAFGRHVLAPLLPAFFQQYPLLQLELVLADRSVDHIKEDFDLSIRFEEQLESGLIARSVARLPVLVCAAPSYLERRGRPTHPAQLKDHSCLGFRLPVDGRPLLWAFEQRGVHIEPELKFSAHCNDIDALAELTVAGAGIARLGIQCVHNLVANGKLEVLFGDLPGKRRLAIPVPLRFYVCYRERKQMPTRLRLLIDYLMQELPKHPSLHLSA